MHLEAISGENTSKERMDWITKTMEEELDEANPFIVLWLWHDLCDDDAVCRHFHQRSRNGDDWLWQVADIDQVLQHDVANGGGRPLPLGQ